MLAPGLQRQAHLVVATRDGLDGSAMMVALAFGYGLVSGFIAGVALGVCVMTWLKLRREETNE